MTERLGDLLVERGLLTEAQLKTALRTQEFFGGHLGSILIDLGFLEEQDLGETLSRAASVRYAIPEDLEDIPTQVLQMIPAKVAERHRVVPIRIQEKRLHLAMLNPRDLFGLDEIASITDMIVIPYVAPEFRIHEALERHYGIRQIRPKRIAMTAPADAGGLPPEASPPAAPERIEPPALKQELGLDGLPLDAEVNLEASALAPSQPSPDTEEFLEQLPRDLNEWRERASREGAPAASSDGPLPDSSGPAAEALPSVQEPPAEAGRRMLAAGRRDEIAEILLNVTARFFRRRLLFIIQRDRIVGWDGAGDGVSGERVRKVLLPLESISIFTAVKEGWRPVVGPVVDVPANRRLYADLGLAIPPEVVLLPIQIKDRLVAVLYGDNGSAPFSTIDVHLLQRFTRQASIALEILILRGKLLSL